MEADVAGSQFVTDADRDRFSPDPPMKPRLEGVAIVRSCAHRSLLQAAGEPRIPRNTRLIWLRERQGGAPLNLG